MKIQTTLKSKIDHNEDLEQLIQHENRLFQLNIHVDHSYHFQSHSVLKIMTTLGTWEIFTSFDIWNKFGDKDPHNPHIEFILWEKMAKYIEKTIIEYIEFLPKTEKGEKSQ